MPKITPADLIHQIAQLDGTRVYDYVSGHSRLSITHIEPPEGPISFVNLDSDGNITRNGRVSRQQLAKIAVICSSRPNYPLHIDRVFSAGGNSRSALETLLAYTPHFFICYPQRVDVYSGEVLTNLKHIMWCPEATHPLGELAIRVYDEMIAEVELGIDFGRIGVTSANLSDEFESIEAKTVHIQMQMALIEIGNALGFRTWIARNDRGISVRDTKLGNLPGVIQTLDEMPILYKREIKEAASLIDCIWFADNGDRIPAVIEIEHSTGVTSGMTRMSKLRETFPAISTTFTVVAPDALRLKVITEANNRLFRSLNARFMPYSTVRELYGLIQRYQLTGVVDYRFIEPFMQKILEN